MKIHVETNFAGVLQRLERLQASLPVVMERAMHPKHGGWASLFRHAAKQSLMASAAAERNVVRREQYLRLVPAFVESFAAVATSNGWEYSLRAPDLGVQLDVESAIATQQTLMTSRGTTSVTETRRMGVDESIRHKQNLELVRQAIRDFVSTPVSGGGKRRDERDLRADGTPLSDDEIVARLERIMGLTTAPDKWSPAMQQASGGLVQALNDFLENGSNIEREHENHLAGLGQNSLIDRATARQWLMIALATWIGLAKTRLAKIARAELHRERIRIASERSLTLS